MKLLENYMNDLISVIIPVYNVEKYLKACVKSVLSQTYSNLEILLIDDGSSDLSSKICDDLANMDTRIRVFHLENGGVSRARNIGVEKSTGDYICFVDSDDILPNYSIQVLYSNLVEHNADFCSGKLRCINPVHDCDFKLVQDVFAKKTDYENWKLFLDQQDWGPCAKIYKSSIIKDNEVEFPLDVKYGEDSIFVTKYLQNCSSAMSINTVVYYYNCLNVSSASHKGYEELRFWILDIVKEYEKLFLKDNEITRYAVSEYALNLFDMVCVLYLLHFGNVDKDKVCFLIEDTYNLFKPYLNGFSTEGIENEKSLNVIKKYKTFFENEDYNGVYKLLCPSNNENFKNRIASKIRLIIKCCSSNVKCFLIFKLGKSLYKF